MFWVLIWENVPIKIRYVRKVQCSHVNSDWLLINVLTNIIDMLVKRRQNGRTDDIHMNTFIWKNSYSLTSCPEYNYSIVKLNINWISCVGVSGYRTEFLEAIHLMDFFEFLQLWLVTFCIPNTISFRTVFPCPMAKACGWSYIRYCNEWIAKNVVFVCLDSERTRYRGK